MEDETAADRPPEDELSELEEAVPEPLSVDEIKALESQEDEENDGEEEARRDVFAMLHSETCRPLSERYQAELCWRFFHERELAVRNRLIEANMRLVASVVRKFFGYCRHVRFEDLVGYGVIGLLKAIRKFEPARGYKLSTYAAWYIRQEVGRNLADKEFDIRLPVNEKDFMFRVQKMANRAGLSVENDWEEVVALAAKELNLDEGKTRLRMGSVWPMRSSLMSLDASSVDGDEGYLARTTADAKAESPEEILAKKELREQIRAAFGRLKENERRVMELRFYRAATVNEVSVSLGLQKNEVANIERRARKKLARFLRDLAPAR